jgi:hypothetical protein
MSFDVGQFLICLSSDGQIVKIKSDLAFASFDSHVVTASGGSFGFGIVPFTYFQELFLMSKASIWIFHVGIEIVFSKRFDFHACVAHFSFLYYSQIASSYFFVVEFVQFLIFQRRGSITCRVYAVFEKRICGFKTNLYFYVAFIRVILYDCSRSRPCPCYYVFAAFM